MESIVESIYPEELFLVGDKTMVITSQSWKELSADDKLLLQKILGAVGQSLESVQVIHQPSLDLQEFPTKAGRILYFGPPTKGLPQHEILTLEGSRVVLTLPLPELQTDANAKKLLWQCLKQLFQG